MTQQHLLPTNSTPLERALSEAFDFLPELGPYADDLAGFKFAEPLNPTIAPWLVVEYGLGGVQSYFATIEELIEAGIPWQRLRGTPVAIETALAWIEYDDALVLDQWPARRKWNRYQIAMGELPGPTEIQRLTDAEYLATISDAARSLPFRGFHGYDVPALVWSNFAWGQCLWSDDSGVRLEGGTVKWSHGREHSVTYEADETDRINLGVNVQNGDEPGWDDFLWDAPGVTWDEVVDAAAFRSWLARQLPAHIGFYDSEGEPIGYRRCYAVTDETDGIDTATLRYQARTGFGDGYGFTAATCALVLRARCADPETPGKQWLAPDEIEFEDGVDPADMVSGPVALAIEFRKTVRQHVTFTMDI